jgi:hypothetical protein
MTLLKRRGIAGRMPRFVKEMQLKEWLDVATVTQEG